MKVCSVPGCERKHWAKGLCQTHYGRLRRIGDVKADMPIGLRRSGCLVEGCTQKHSALGYCKRHYVAFKRWGDPLENHRRVHVTEHGTYNEYQNYGCRCDECRQANTDFTRKRNHRLGRNRPAAIVRAERRAAALTRHGTTACYKIGCRCDECRKASTDDRKARRRANIEATRAYDREYKRRRRQSVAA